MICEIKSSRDFARRGALGFTTAFTGTALARSGAPAGGFSSNAGIVRNAFCVVGGSIASLTAIGAGFRDGSPSGALGDIVGHREDWSTLLIEQEW